MVKFILFLMLLLPLFGSATDYFVKTGGSDVANGLSDATAWGSITRVNTATLVNGDRVFFKRGDTFTGSLVLSKSALSTAKVQYGAYGTGNRPVISNMQTITGWTLFSTGVYRAPVAIPTNCNIVTVDGVNTNMGKYPATGENTFESYSALTSITDAQLTGTPNFAGGEVVIWKSNWTIDRSAITGHTNGTITYTSGSSWAVQSSGGYKYYIQKHINCLLKFGDWYTDGSYFYMYFGANSPSGYLVKAGSSDYTVSLDRKNYNTLRDLKIEGGNLAAIYCLSSVGFNLVNCEVTNTGRTGVTVITNAQTGASTATLIDSCLVTHTNGTGVWLNSAGSTVRNTNFEYNGEFAGMADPAGGSHYGLYTKGVGNITEWNHTYMTGYIPIYWESDYAQVRYNVVSDFPTLAMLLDGGGIYTFSSVTNTGQRVYSNIVKNSLANGLYSDGGSNHIEYFNNIVVNVQKWGIHMNEPVSNYVHHNTIYGCGIAGIDVSNQYYLSILAANNTLASNILVQTSPTQKFISLQDQNTNNAILGFGASDNNTFVADLTAGSVFFNQKGSASSLPFSAISYDFASWKTLTGKESNSTMPLHDVAGLMLIYNDTNEATPYPITGAKKDLAGTIYQGSVTLQPFTSMLLIPTTITAPVNVTKPTLRKGGGYRLDQSGRFVLQK